MNVFIKRSVRHALSSVALLLLLLAAGAPAAHAQIVFGVQLSDEGQAALKKDERMDARQLLKLLRSEGRLVYKGKKPVEAKLVVFGVGPKGKGRTVLESKPFRLKPGLHAAGEMLPPKPFYVYIDKAFPDDFFLPDTYFFPDDFFFPDGHFLPKSVHKELKLKKGQVGLVMALVPVDEKLRKKAQSRPMGLVLAPAR